MACRYVVMETTVLDYPAAFEVKPEYRPECDTRPGSIGSSCLDMFGVPSRGVEAGRSRKSGREES